MKIKALLFACLLVLVVVIPAFAVPVCDHANVEWYGDNWWECLDCGHWEQMFIRCEHDGHGDPEDFPFLFWTVEICPKCGVWYWIINM